MLTPLVSVTQTKKNLTPQLNNRIYSQPNIYYFKVSTKYHNSHKYSKCLKLIQMQRTVLKYPTSLCTRFFLTQTKK